MILTFCRPAAVCFALAVSPSLASHALAQESDETARRIAALAAVAIDEYALGVVDGQVVLPEEFHEARLFLAEARATADELPAPVRAATVAALDRLLAGVAALRPAEELREQVAALRTGLKDALGVTLDQFPASPPSLALGARVYAARCAQCHGLAGAGDGAMAAGLDPPPADLTDPALATASPLEFFRKVNVGVAGTGMPAYEDQLSLDERWSVALYASTLRHAGAEPERGADWVTARCPGCRVVLSGFTATAPLTDDSLRGLVSARAGAPPPEGLDVVAWARTAAAAEVLGRDRALAARRVTREAAETAARALALLSAGERAAASREALNAYLTFEGIEASVAARDAATARAVERAFRTFRAAVDDGDRGAAAAGRERFVAALDEAAILLERGDRAPVLFGQSLVIMLREGLEAILIIGALIAFLVRAGAEERVRELGWGAVAAIGASFATAGAFVWIFRVSAAQREALEGVTMLLAAAVLFSVASWLVSKIEAEKWKAFVGGQMKKAMASQGRLALAGLAFLVVYREGFETVLFYAALYSMAESAAGTAGITTGIAVGAVALAFIYLAIRKYGVKLPLKPIFAITGVLLLVLAFSFAGQGVAELQEAGWISMTPLRWVPSFPLLGLFPTLQTLMAQLAVAAAFLLAVSWFYWWHPRLQAARP